MTYQYVREPRILKYWDDLPRVAGSPKRGHATASPLIGIPLGPASPPSRVAPAAPSLPSIPAEPARFQGPIPNWHKCRLSFAPVDLGQLPGRDPRWLDSGGTSCSDQAV